MKNAIAIFFLMMVVEWGMGQQDVAHMYNFGGSAGEEGREIIQTSDGGFAIIGTTGSDLENESQIYLVKLDSLFNCQWSNTYGGMGVDRGYSILEAENGNLIVCGFTNSFQSQTYDAVVYRLTCEGDFIWTKHYGGSDWDFAYKIIHSAQDGYFVVGQTYSYGNGGGDGWILHIDEAGNVMDNWTYGGELEDGFVDIVQLENGALAAVGTTKSLSDDENKKAWLKKIAPNGLELWDDVFQDVESFGTGVTKNEQDEILWCGNQILNGNNHVGFHQKVLPSGEIALNIIENYDGDLEFNSISVIYGNTFRIGRTNLAGYGGYDGVVHEMNDAGNFLAGPTYGFDKEENLFDMIAVNDHEFLFCGVGNSYSIEHTDQLFLVRHVFYNDYVAVPVEQYEIEDNEACIALAIDEVTLATNEFPLDAKVYVYDLAGRFLCIWDAEKFQNRAMKLDELMVIKVVDTLGQVIYRGLETF